MQITAIIPARYSSSRLPGKPLINIAGEPMILHVCRQVLAANNVDRLVVATDHKGIYDVVVNAGYEAVMTDPSLPSGSDRIASAAKELGIEGPILNVQGDEPMIDPETIDSLIDAFRKEKPDCATPITRIQSSDHLFDVNRPKVVVRTDSTALYFSRTAIPYQRDSPENEWLKVQPYYGHIGLYLYSNHALQQFVSSSPTSLEQSEQLEQLRMLELGMRILCVEVDYYGVAVDTLEDVKTVEELMKAEK